jgi:hypothetical protein
MWDARLHGTVFSLSFAQSYSSSKNPSLFRINLNGDLESTFWSSGDGATGRHMARVTMPGAPEMSAPPCPTLPISPPHSC